MDLVISKSQLTIKAQNLEATLPAIIFICDVFHLSLQEQDHKKGAGVQKGYKNATQLEFKASNNKESEVDGTLEAEQRLYPDQPTKTSPLTVRNGSTHPNYNSANFSALQVITACGAYGRVVISYQRHVKDDLSKGLPVIDNTSTMMT